MISPMPIIFPATYEKLVALSIPEPKIPRSAMTEREYHEMFGLELPERTPGPMDLGSKENGSMAVTTPLPTETALRGQAGFTFPEELRGIVPLLLIFGLVVLILFKK